MIMEVLNTIWDSSGDERFIGIFCYWAACVNVDADTFAWLTPKECS